MAAEEQAGETVAELESRGYTHIEIKCAVCDHISRRSLFLLRTRGEIARNMTFEAVARHVSCAKCKAKPHPGSACPVQQEIASPEKARKVRKDSR